MPRESPAFTELLKLSYAYAALNSFPDKVCGQYRDGDVVGDQCESFCGPEPLLKIDSCQTWHGGKELVFSATLGPRKVSEIFLVAGCLLK